MAPCSKLYSYLQYQAFYLKVNKDISLLASHAWAGFNFSGSTKICIAVYLADEPEDYYMMHLACKKFSANDVADFLTEIELSQYAESFKTEEISGEVLFEAGHDLLVELGVSNSSHQVQIIRKFHRKLRGIVRAIL